MTIDTKQFIILYREAFGENAPLPIVFYYSNEAAATPVKTGGCMFKQIVKAKEGENIALDSETVTCGGGRHYAGFAPLPEYVYTFVSEKERYKATPQDVADCMHQFDIRLTDKKYLNFVRVDKATDWEGIEGLLFFATPDMLSGLATWAYFDNNSEDAVSAIFGAGCTTVISHAVRENRRGGRRTFIGLFDPSVRPYVQPDELSFVIPASRLPEMLATLRRCCLFDTPAWQKIKARLQTTNPSK